MTPATDPHAEIDQQATPPAAQIGTPIDLNNLPKQIHNWVDRGLKVSCEGAGHPHHSHFKVKR